MTCRNAVTGARAHCKLIHGAAARHAPAQAARKVATRRAQRAGAAAYPAELHAGHR